MHDPDRGANGSLYVSTTGHARLDDEVESDRMDTLWWYDGTSAWHRTGLRGDTQGRTKAPTFAVILDPDNANIVYVGTAVGVWRCTLSFSGTTPSWTWQALLNGMPEAAVQDLSFFKNGNTKLLRAALQARGIWELDLSSNPMPPGRTFLRSNAVDTRRSAPPAVTSPLSPLTNVKSYLWHESPDVRIRPQPGQAPHSPRLPIQRPDDYSRWVFQTALHAHDPLCRPNGRDSQQFKQRLWAFLSAQGLSSAQPFQIDAALWNRAIAVGQAFADPWDGDEPTESDLYELISNRELTLPFASAAMRAIRVRRQPHHVDVLVHHRHIRPLLAADVSVLLLQREIASTEDPNTLALSAAWKSAVADLVTIGTGTLDDSWSLADPTGAWHPRGPVSARTPRAVTFDLDLTSVQNHTHLFLLAVVTSTRDAITAARLGFDPPASPRFNNLRDLVLNSHHVAPLLLSVWD